MRVHFMLPIMKNWFWFLSGCLFPLVLFLFALHQVLLFVWCPPGLTRQLQKLCVKQLLQYLNNSSLFLLCLASAIYLVLSRFYFLFGCHLILFQLCVQSAPGSSYCLVSSRFIPLFGLLQVLPIVWSPKGSSRCLVSSRFIPLFSLILGSDVHLLSTRFSSSFGLLHIQLCV